MLSEAASVRDPGQLTVERHQRAVCSTDHPIVTNAVLRVLRDGGNAIDAAIVASLLQATVEPFMTNLAGSITLLYWDAATAKLHALDAMGTMEPGLAPFRPVPASAGGFAGLLGREPCATIPGFMPALQLMHDRFASKTWAYLCEEPIHWADEGHPISSFEHSILDWNLGFNTYFPEGRALFLEGGFTRPVGARFRNPDLARTLRGVAREGPDYLISGAWAQSFVEKANALGWAITLDSLSSNPPQWSDPVLLPWGERTIAQLPLPQVETVMTAIVLGIISGCSGGQGAPDEPDAIYAMCHALRLAAQHVGFVNDTELFDSPIDVLLDPQYHAYLARLVNGSRPKVDLRKHLQTANGLASMHAAGLHGPAPLDTQGSGSCELAIVDRDGNWVQMVNTLQTGGLPGMVIGGVPMVGSHTTIGTINSGIDSVLFPKSRLRSITGNTIVLRNGVPEFSLGTPGMPQFTVPQVLANILVRNMDYAEAIQAPRMWALGDDHSLAIESRLPQNTIEELGKLGLRLTPTLEYDWHFGSFQMAWREDDGTFGSLSDLRRCGVAGGLVV